MGSLRRVTSGAIVVLNILSCVLMWVCVFSKSDWVKEIRADESPFINRQQYGYIIIFNESKYVLTRKLSGVSRGCDNTIDKFCTKNLSTKLSKCLPAIFEKWIMNKYFFEFMQKLGWASGNLKKKLAKKRF